VPDRPAYADLTDQELMARHAEGDADAFGEVVRRHRDRLWAVALRTLGDPDEAADAVQDALVSAFRASARGGYRGDAAVTTWLHRIVVNACIDRVRRRRARPSVPTSPEDLDVPAPGDQTAARETAIVIESALATLPFDQRAALVLVDLQGWSVDEAAAILEVAPGTVKSRCSRGRARLLPLLADLRGNRRTPEAVPSEKAEPVARTPARGEQP
jgi:RNA polymerase sigma-70 factor (ECF subfamily)